MTTATVESPPEVPFKEIHSIGGKRVLAYDQEVMLPMAPSEENGKLVRRTFRRMTPMQMTEGVDSVPVEMVVKLLDRCRYFEEESARLQADVAALRSELERADVQGEGRKSKKG